VNTAHRIVALRTESMTMMAFQLEGVELTPRLADLQFPQLLRSAQLNRASDPSRYDARLTLRGPAGPANKAALARVVADIARGEKLSAAEFARRATAWLQDRHAYALSVKIPAGADQDSIVRWLQSNEPGFCEYFAAALTVLAREAGYPARMVAGFHGGMLNGFENYFMVKNSDAHAWVEIYDGTTAWFRTDPTPGSAGARTAETAAVAQEGQDSSWSARFDSLRILWYRRIVNFDSRQQGQMMDQVKTYTNESSAALRERLEAFAKVLRAWLEKPWDGQRIGRVAGGVLGVVALGVLLVLLVRSEWQRWRWWRMPAGSDPIRERAGRWLGRLKAERIGETGNDGQEVRQVVRDLQRLRYGHRDSWPEPRAVFRRARQARRAGGSRISAMR
jgi:transglutaminase-like putative cysteine protease